MSDNPFVYEQAHLIPEDVIAHDYIDDHNHGRLLRSRRNIFLIGERGSGKTMALLYNTLPVQRIVATKCNRPLDLTFVGALIPANTPLTHRREYQLLKTFRAAIVSEHFLALAIVFHLAESLGPVLPAITEEESSALRMELEFYFGFKLPTHTNILDAIGQVAQRESIRAQRTLNDPTRDALYPQALSFASLVVPLMRALRKTEVLHDSHFMLMVDDAHSLNRPQVEALNSWIAYRDRKLYSFKVASARVGQPNKATASGGDILEGHDFLTIDMERPIHNESSDYGRFAAKVVSRRLQRVGVDSTPEDCFPVHEGLKRELEEAGERVRAKVARTLSDGRPKAMADYVYKHRWAEYMRERSPKANRPRYSGFSTLTFISTGVIRNLLEPCWWMWDAAMSELADDERAPAMLSCISPGIQARKILERSDAAWDRLGKLDVTIEGCSHINRKRVQSMFEKLGQFFVRRLQGHRSEPNATSFSLSAKDDMVMLELDPLLDIAQRAQLLYVRTGAAKTKGKREEYYVPNRILWPSIGLDPHGQHARASIRAGDLLNAAEGVAIPFGGETAEEQRSFFETQEGE